MSIRIKLCSLFEIYTNQHPQCWAAVLYSWVSTPSGAVKCFWGRLTKIILGQRGCLLSNDTDLGLTQSRFYAVVDRTSWSQTNGSFPEVKEFKSICVDAHSHIFPPLKLRMEKRKVGVYVHEMSLNVRICRTLGGAVHAMCRLVLNDARRHVQGLSHWQEQSVHMNPHFPQFEVHL